MIVSKSDRVQCTINPDLYSEIHFDGKRSAFSIFHSTPYGELLTYSSPYMFSCVDHLLDFLIIKLKTYNMKFDITNITMSHRATGGYQIKGIVNGISVIANTNDSEAFDWWNDESQPELHTQALLHCEWKLEEQYLSL